MKPIVAVVESALMHSANISYERNAAVSDAQLNALFAASWPDYRHASFHSVRQASLAYICAFKAAQLVGYVNLAWDGRAHAFLLDPTVHPSVRRMGVGRALVTHAVAAAKESGVEWVHVDFEPRLGDFYRLCGFRPTDAGVINTTETEAGPL